MGSGGVPEKHNVPRIAPHVAAVGSASARVKVCHWVNVSLAPRGGATDKNTSHRTLSSESSRAAWEFRSIVRDARELVWNAEASERTLDLSCSTDLYLTVKLSSWNYYRPPES